MSKPQCPGQNITISPSHCQGSVRLPLSYMVDVTCRQKHGYAKTDVCSQDGIKDSVTRIDSRVSTAI